MKMYLTSVILFFIDCYFDFRHSLSAACLIGELNCIFGTQFHVHDLFLNPNVKAMASLLDKNLISASNEIDLMEELNFLVDDSIM